MEFYNISNFHGCYGSCTDYMGVMMVSYKKKMLLGLIEEYAKLHIDLSKKTIFNFADTIAALDKTSERIHLLLDSME